MSSTRCLHPNNKNNEKALNQKEDGGVATGGVVNAYLNGCVGDSVCDDVHDGVCDVVCDVVCDCVCDGVVLEVLMVVIIFNQTSLKRIIKFTPNNIYDLYLLVSKINEIKN